MCGLAGIFAYQNEAPALDRDELLRIRERMRNRGPDGAGIWVSNDQRVGLAHRRLSIIDLSEGGAQPMMDADTGNQIVFNGEIYNYQALRKDLEAVGQRFHSHSDTEVLLKLYAQYGAGMVRKLRGMYAFAIWDTHRQGIFLARDPFGIKPLYLADDGKTLRFASQVKALLAGGAVDTQPEPAGHTGFFLWGHVPEPYTLYKGIRAFPAGTSLWIDRSGRKREERFFDLTQELAHAATAGQINIEQGREVLRAALLDTVRHHLVADVPVGLFLSAGLDSASLLGLSSECLSANSSINTVTLAFDEFACTAYDEAALAEMLAKHYGSRHITQRLKRHDFVDQIDSLLDAMDQPSIDGVNSYFVCKAAREAGLKVALSGLGGDELFAGYSHFRTIPRMVRWLKPFVAQSWIGRNARRLSVPFVRGAQVSPKAAGLIEYGGDIAGAYLLRRSLHMPWELGTLLDDDFAKEGLLALQTLRAIGQTIHGLSADRAKISAMETQWYMRNQLLRDVDWAGMAHGLEVRVPLVDIELFRAVQTLIAANYPAEKQNMVSTLMRPMLDAVLQRKKTGFSVPINEWLMESRSQDVSNKVNLREWSNQVYRQYIGQPTLSYPYDPDQRLLSSRVSKQVRVGILATEVVTLGGIQSFMLRITEVMRNAKDEGVASEATCISLNDSTDDLRSNTSIPPEVDVWGATRSKVALILYALLKMPHKDMLFVGHLHLGPLAFVLKKLGKVDGYHVIIHGIEAWGKLSIFQRWALLAARSVVATTQFTVKECARYNAIPLSRFCVIPLCANEKRVSPSPSLKLHGRFKLLSVGRQDASERYKGFEQIFRALVQLKATHQNIHLNIVGKGDDQLRLMSVAEDLGVGHQVTFLGALSDEDLAAAYRDCDVFVLPSKKEGFGIVFLEAMQWRKPCIGGNHGGTPEVIEHGGSGYLVDYDEVTKLADYIRQYAGDQSLCRDFGERGYQLLEDRFSHKEFLREYRKLLVNNHIHGE